MAFHLRRWLAVLLLAVTFTMPAMAAVYVERSPGEVAPPPAPEPPPVAPQAAPMR